MPRPAVGRAADVAALLRPVHELGARGRAERGGAGRRPGAPGGGRERRRAPSPAAREPSRRPGARHPEARAPAHHSRAPHLSLPLL